MFYKVYSSTPDLCTKNYGTAEGGIAQCRRPQITPLSSTRSTLDSASVGKPTPFDIILRLFPGHFQTFSSGLSGNL